MTPHEAAKCHSYSDGLHLQPPALTPLLGSESDPPCPALRNHQWQSAGGNASGALVSPRHTTGVGDFSCVSHDPPCHHARAGAAAARTRSSRPTHRCAAPPCRAAHPPALARTPPRPRIRYLPTRRRPGWSRGVVDQCQSTAHRGSMVESTAPSCCASLDDPWTAPRAPSHADPRARRASTDGRARRADPAQRCDTRVSAKVTPPPPPPQTALSQAVSPSAPSAKREHMMRVSVTKPRRFNYLWDADITNPTTSSTSDAPPPASADGAQTPRRQTPAAQQGPSLPTVDACRPAAALVPSWQVSCSSPDDDATCRLAGTPVAAALLWSRPISTPLPLHPPPEAVK